MLIHGRRASITGQVCIDQFMVDVTKIPEVTMGDEVILIGRDGGEEISAMAKRSSKETAWNYASSSWAEKASAMTLRCIS